MPPSRDDQDSLLGRARSAWRNRGKDHAAQTGRRGPDDSWVASTKGDDAAVTDATNDEGVTDTSADDSATQDSATQDETAQDEAVEETTSAETADTTSSDDAEPESDGTPGEADNPATEDDSATEEPSAEAAAAPDDAEPEDAESEGAQPGEATDSPDTEAASEAAPDKSQPAAAEQTTDQTPEQTTDAPKAARPKPKGGRGIDSATKVIRREDLPDISELEDLENIEAEGGAEAEAEAEKSATDRGEKAPSDTPKTKRSGIGPSDSATTVIQRGDLPDSADLDDLSEIDALGGGAETAAATADADSNSDHADSNDDQAADGSTKAFPTGTDTTGTTAEPTESDDAETRPVTKAAAATAAAGAAAAGGAAAGAAGGTTSAAQGWSTTAHKPTVYPGKDDTSKPKPAKESSGSRRWPLLVGAAVVVVIAVIGGIFAYMNLRAPAPADEAADVAKDFSTALYEGDLSTLRSTTCGERHEFYTTISDADFQKIYDGQKTRNELIQVNDVKAVKVTGDGDQAVVEVSAQHSSKPDAPQTVTINLQKSGDDWKVCTPQ
ncbi:DUF4878 domain-containing protein [Gordonia sp. SL306]|uniref:Rv0361 family membrane protein n=1 Tax=Gordonia sp. SL306 TaxID=2995145 RepID=UPI0022702A77|nr:DUF4878 domain-containing protein [Gordonia sp. SL306]WAC56978.1 DUF4878 domain-containing protein [Gordonia sp. SL306]